MSDLQNKAAAEGASLVSHNKTWLVWVGVAAVVVLALAVVFVR